MLTRRYGVALGIALRWLSGPALRAGRQGNARIRGLCCAGSFGARW
jgi:hypothetical protein